MRSAFEQTLYRIRLMIEEGQDQEALARLDAIRTDDPAEQREITYLRAWYYNRLEQWDEATRYLSPLYDPCDIEENWDEASHSERERRAFYLLWLGNAAVNLSHYADASHYFSQCLKVLQKRRVHLPRVRIKALYSLGTTSIVNGFYAAAIQHYEEALRLCLKEGEESDLAHIYYGLCDAHRLSGNFDQAYAYGERALKFYREQANRYMEGRMQNLLGRICLQAGDRHSASDHYMEALSIATLDDQPGMKLINFVALAELRLDENRLDEAKRFCQRAQEVAASMKDDHLFGMLYLVYSKVAQAQADQAQGEERYMHLRDALHFLERAKDHLSLTQANTHLSELYGRFAQVLEALGQPQEALVYWKSACEMLADPKGQGWY